MFQDCKSFEAFAFKEFEFKTNCKAFEFVKAFEIVRKLFKTLKTFVIFNFETFQA